MTDALTPERAIRLLRAKAAELEADVHDHDVRRHPRTTVTYLTADVALIAQLLADHIERTSIADEVNSSPRPVAPPVHSEASGSVGAPFDSGTRA